MLPLGDTSQFQRQIWTQSERVEMIFQVNGIQRKVGIAVLISSETDFKIKKK